MASAGRAIHRFAAMLGAGIISTTQRIPGNRFGVVTKVAPPAVAVAVAAIVAPHNATVAEKSLLAGLKTGPWVDLSRLPLVEDLVAEHAEEIAEVRAHPDLEGRLSPDKHDDLFLLRYVLSAKGDVAASASTVGRALDWKAKNAGLVARLESMRPEVQRASPVGMLPWLTAEGRPVMIALPFAGDNSELEAKSSAWHLEAGVSNRAMAFAAADRLSRETGRFVKLVLVQDLTGASVSAAMRQRRLMSVQGQLSELQELLFPQLLDRVVLTHPPPFVGALVNLAGTFLCSGLFESSRKRFAYGGAAVAEETGLPQDLVPAFLGGGCDWSPAWVPESMRPPSPTPRDDHGPAPDAATSPAA